MVHGFADIWVHRNGLHPWRWLLPADSLRDTVRLIARFRAVYHWEKEYATRLPRSIPGYPHRMPRGPAPDARATAQRLFLDERSPCETLPIYSPESVLSSLPPTWHRSAASAVLDIRPDTAGRLGQRPGWKEIRVLAVDDTSLVRSFESQTGLRFRKEAPDQVYATVRCTLTLHRREG